MHLWPGSPPTGMRCCSGSYLGGSGGSPGYPEAAQAIALDWQGNAYLAGVTSSTNFPLLSPLQSSLDGETDAFVTKVSASGNIGL